MKKFEIVNHGWIKVLDLEQNYLLQAVKISAITTISSGKMDEDSQRILGKLYNIFIQADGNSVMFYYKNSEEEQYKTDLAFLEELLFSKS